MGETGDIRCSPNEGKIALWMRLELLPQIRQETLQYQYHHSIVQRENWMT